jgi:hypothetical protein
MPTSGATAGLGRKVVGADHHRLDGIPDSVGCET